MNALVQRRESCTIGQGLRGGEIEAILHLSRPVIKALFNFTKQEVSETAQKKLNQSVMIAELNPALQGSLFLKRGSIYGSSGDEKRR